MSTENKNDFFVGVLEALSYGTTTMQLSDKLRKCVAASRETGKMSTLTLTLKIKPRGDAAGIEYDVVDSSKAVIPENDKGSTVMFGDELNELHDEHPNVIAKKKRLEQQKSSNIRNLNKKGETK